MTFEQKISGTRVTDYEIELIHASQFVDLVEISQIIKRAEAMNYLLDTFRFYPTETGHWVAILDYDSLYKLTILNSYPEYEQELREYFGENWLKHYIRFNH